MTRFLISFDDGAMDDGADDLAAVADAAHAVLRDAKEAGVWVTGGGVPRQQATVVDVDGAVRPGEYPETKAVVGGFSIIDVPTLDDALVWAARFAAACRCAQEVRALGEDPEA